MIIYKTTNLINGKLYIGKDQKNNPKYFGSGYLLKKSIKKYGKENFKKEILEYCDNIEDLNKKEIYWIKKLNAINDGYNIAEGGTGGNTLIGKTKIELNENSKKHSISAKKYWNSLSDEQKKEVTKNYHSTKGTKNNKMSIQRMGKGNPMFGNHMYKIWIEKYGEEIAIKKMDEWKIKMNTDDRKRKISIKMKNRILTDEHKLNISKSKKNKPSTTKGRIWIYKDFKNSMILPEYLDDFIKNGWQKGRYKHR